MSFCYLKHVLNISAALLIIEKISTRVLKSIPPRILLHYTTVLNIWLFWFSYSDLIYLLDTHILL